MWQAAREGVGPSKLASYCTYKIIQFIITKHGTNKTDTQCYVQKTKYMQKFLLENK